MSDENDQYKIYKKNKSLIKQSTKSECLLSEMPFMNKILPVYIISINFKTIFYLYKGNT